MINVGCADKATAEAQPCQDDNHRKKAGDLPLGLKIASLPPNLRRLSSPYSFPWHGGWKLISSPFSSHIKYPLHVCPGLLCPGREGETRLHLMSEVMFSYPALPQLSLYNNSLKTRFFSLQGSQRLNKCDEFHAAQ